MAKVPTSLPARPPPPLGFQNGGFKGFMPRAVSTNNHTYAASSAPAVGPVAPTASYNNSTAAYNGAAYYDYGNGYQQQAQAYYQQPGYDYQQQYAAPQQYSAPHIVNPFPIETATSRARPGYDPEQEAAIANWQSAYMPKDDATKSGSGRGTGNASAGGANAIPLANNRLKTHMDDVDVSAVAANINSDVAAVITDKEGKQKTVVRSGGGKTWQDPSLLEWNPAHHRLFVGNLAGEVTDDSLFKAFSRYASLSKARVVRDKRTSKSKGFGFVSFSEPDDYFKAFQEMQNKYIGSHPVKIKPSDTDIKVTKATLQQKQNQKKGQKDVLAANTGAGVHKNLKPQNGPFKAGKGAPKFLG